MELFAVTCTVTTRSPRLLIKPDDTDLSRERVKQLFVKPLASSKVYDGDSNWTIAGIAVREWIMILEQ